MQPMLNIAVRAARAAGNLISLKFEDRQNFSAEEKSKNDFVTSVDRECERLIAEILLKAYPAHRVLGEEFGVSGDAGSEFEWIVDPVDGTANFLKGIPHVAVSIGLRVKGVTAAGVVFDPIRNELFTAARGEGAQLNGRRIRAGQSRSLDGTVIATAFPFKKRELLPAYMKMFAAVFDRCGDVRRAGAASLDLAYVAAGRLDGYFELGLKPWDFCAGELICREAGAVVTDFAGGNDIYASGDVVCGNPRVVQALVRAVRSGAEQAAGK